MKKLFFLLIIFFSVYSQEPYYIMAGKNFSSFVGAEDILFVQQGMERASDNYLKIPENKRMLNSLARISGMVLIWIPLNNFELVLQHEVFGHGYRIRDIGSSVSENGYSFQLPFPYGKGGGATKYSYDSDFTCFEEIAISAGGVEGTAVLANTMKMKSMYDLKLDGRKSFLYIFSQQDLTGYAYTISDFNDAGDGNDMQSYMYWLNSAYYYDYFSVRALKNAVLLNLLDPFTYYNVGAMFFYMVKGNDMNVPMLKWKNIRFLPNARAALAPYGLEYYIENFISYKQSPIYSYVRWGEHAKNIYGGIGLEWREIWHAGKTKWGVRCDLFYQPKIYFKKALAEQDGVQCIYSYKDLKKKRAGITLYLILNSRISKNKSYGFYADFGYKTKGFVQGQSLKNSFIFDIGFGTDVF